MLSIGRIFAGDGWRYLWEQVAVGAEDYYLADVARGETQGRWCGSAARPELGLAGEVTKEQMHRVFGLLVHPTEDVELGRAPRIYRSLDQRLSAARRDHDEAQQQAWDRRAVELAEARAPMERIEAERRAHQAASTETWAEREAVIRRGGERHAVAGFDLTFSPPKSVSVLWAAADRDGRETIWQAHREGVRAALDYLEREAAWSRSGYNGIRQIDTTGWVIAAFEHRMSRAGDVQIHTHSAVLNRARCPDGEWRSLDGRAVYRVAASAGALYDRVREAALERDLGVRHETRKPGGPREIVGVDEDVCRLFSSRRVQVEGRVAELADAYRARNDGAEPSPWTLTQMSRWATLETRQHKKRSEGTPEALARWEGETRGQLGRSLARVWERAIHRELNNQHGGGVNGRHAAQQQTTSDEELVAAAVGAVDASKSTWTRYDLARQVTLTLPADRSGNPEWLLGRVDQLVERALGAPAEQFGVIDLSACPVFDTPTELRRHKDGQSVYAEHGATRYTTRAALAKERAALETGGRDDGPRLDPSIVGAVLRAAHLGDDQTEAVRRLATSGKQIEALVGPAGTGKTSTMRALAAAWKADGRAVIGLAVSETATRVLARQAAIRAANTAKLLYEHIHRHPSIRDERWWRDQYAIVPGSLVILDEASMASRDEIDQLNRLCQQHDAKLLLVGDHEQLASPTTGGLFRLLVEQVGAVELDQVHRFANQWETDASLALRAANPDVLAEYDLRGRIHGGSDGEMEDAAFTAALADRARGVRTFLLADTNETAARLAGRTRDQLVVAGAVDDTRTVELADENRAGVGDHIVTRDNDRTNRTDRGHFVANRDTWQITSVQPDGTLAVSRVDPDSGQPRPDDTTVLDAAYVAEHVQLAYAGTVHAAQGATGATTHAIITANTTRAALHVALTRGRDENHAYVICARPEGADRDGPTEDPLAVLAAILERDDTPDERAALAVQAEADETARSLKTLFPVWQDLIATAGRPRWQQAITDTCGPELAEQMLASPAWHTLAARLRVLDAAGIDSPTALAGAARRRDFDDADDIAAVLHWRLGGAETNARILLGDTFGELSPIVGGEMERAVTQVAAAMDARTGALGEQVEAERPAWAAQLGPLADDPEQREDWRRRAGIVAGYREAFDVHPDGPDPIGSSPPVGRPDARAWWQRAAAALDRREPATLARSPDEYLEAIVEQSRAAYRSAPDPVADRLRELYRSLREARTAEGVARHAGAITASQAAAREAESLARAVVETEAAHQRRKSWLVATGRLREHGEAAQAELDLRHAANADTSTASTSLPALRQRVVHAKARLESMEATLRHAQDLKDRCDEKIARLNTELELLLTTRPATTRATSAIAAEHRVADRIDHLRAALNHRRLGLNTLRGTKRDTLQTELDHLVRTHPPLASPLLRDPRWEQIRTEGNDVHDRAVGHHRSQIADEQSRRDQRVAIAQACQAEHDSRATTYDKLTAALEKRASRTRPAGGDDIVHSRRAAAPAHQSRSANPAGFDSPTTLRHDINPPPIEPPSQAGPSLEP